MIHKPFDQVGRDDVEDLVTNEVTEGRTIEYKEALPGNADKDKKEFLGDVSSFANAAGGDLLYGVAEKRDAENKTTGLPESVRGLAGVNVDQAIRRLDSMIEAGIGPRITGIRIRPIDGFPEGPVLLMRIPKSYAAPHMVTFQEHSRFYSRNNGGKYPLDVQEIRSAFALSESLPERVRRWRDERLARIVAEETPLAVGDGPKIVLHILPLSALAGGFTIDLHVLHDQHLGLALPCFNTPGHPCRFNLDGVLSFDPFPRPPGDQSGVAYAQAFRNGAVEFVDGYTLQGHVAEHCFPATVIEQIVIRGVTEYSRTLSRLEVPTPLVIMLTVLGVRGCRIVSDSWRGGTPLVDRDDLVLPDLLLEDYEQDLKSVLRPAFDAMWQAAGCPRSMSYRPNGEWSPRR
jgi:hypothetical protein